MARALILVRQSITHKDSVSLESQEAACRAYCDREGHAVTAVLSEASVRGWWDEREMIQEIYGRAGRREFDTLVTWDISRVARTVRHIENLIYDLGKRGASYESISEPYVKHPVMRQVMGAMAEEQTRTISRNVASAVRRNALQGKWHGFEPYGYRRGPDRRLVVVPGEAQIVRTLFVYFADGWSVAEVRRWLTTDPTVPPRRRGGRWSVGAVWNALHAEVYRGVVVIAPGIAGAAAFDGIRVEGAHEAIVPAETWERVRRRLGDGRPAARSTKIATHWLEGHVWCRCGEPMYYVARRTRPNRLWECRAATLHRNGVRPEGCPQPRSLAGAGWVERGTVALLGATLARAGSVTDDQLRRSIGAPDRRAEAAQKDLAELRRQEANLVDSLAHGIPPQTVAPKLAALAEKIAEAERTARAFAPGRTLDDLLKARGFAADLAGTIADLTPLQLRAVAERIGLRVTVDPLEWRVTLSFGPGFAWLGEPTRAGKRAGGKSQRAS